MQRCLLTDISRSWPVKYELMPLTPWACFKASTWYLLLFSSTVVLWPWGKEENQANLWARPAGEGTYRPPGPMQLPEPPGGWGGNGCSCHCNPSPSLLSITLSDPNSHKFFMWVSAVSHITVEHIRCLHYNRAQAKSLTLQSLLTSWAMDR